MKRKVGWINYTKKAEIEVSFCLSFVHVVSCVEILKSATSHPFQMPRVRSQGMMLFLRLSRDRSLSVLFVFIVGS